MSKPSGAYLIDKNGLRAHIEPLAQPTGADSQLIVRTPSGQKVLVPAQALVERKDGSYFLPLSLAELSTNEAPSPEYDNTTVMPVIVEEVDVERRTVERGRVRVTKKVHEEEKTVDEPLKAEDVEVKRVPVNRVVDAPVPVRHVGDTMIVPLLEETLVVEKRLVLKEELHITKRQVETRNPQQIVLRSEEAVIERFDAQGELRNGKEENNTGSTA